MSLTSEQALIQYTQSVPGEAFSVPFYFLAAADLAVVRIRSGVSATLVIVTDYTVTNAGTNPSSAVVTMVAGLAADTVTIYRNAQELQPTNFANLAPLLPTTLTKCLDRLTMFVQQLTLATSRSFRFANTAAVVAPLNIDLYKGKVLGFDSNGVPTPVTNGGGGGGGTFGEASISTGALTVAVTFATAFATTPKVVVSVQMPDSSGNNIFATVLRDSVTTAGFTVSLSGPTPGTGYYLTYTAGL